MAIHESGEDYLEAILMIKKRSGNVRSIDVARELSFSKPSVSVAMKNLKTSNYITVDENGFINLTEAGQEIADKIYERHYIFHKIYLQFPDQLVNFYWSRS